MEELRYIQLIDKFESNEEDIGPVALDILEIFAHNKCLSAYQVFSKVKSTHLEMAYKNIHKRIQRLQVLQLIQEIEIDKDPEHRAKYYRLTEYGVFQLFLKRLPGVIYDELRSEKEAATYFTGDIFWYYGDSALFEIFLYSHINKKTISVVNSSLLLKLYHYLRECCRAIDEVLQNKKHGSLVKRYRYFWNKVPGEHDKKLLKSIKEIFNIEKIDLETINIEKNDYGNTLKISHPEFHITIELDRQREKAIAKHNELNKIYEYEIDDIGYDIIVLSGESDKELIKYEFNRRRLVEMLIYKIILDFAKSNRKEDIDTFNVISSDYKFMRLIDNVHDSFNSGYSKLKKSST